MESMCCSGDYQPAGLSDFAFPFLPAILHPFMAVQVPLKDLPSGETQDLQLNVGPPKNKKEKNPLLGGIRVSTSHAAHMLQA